MLDQAAPRPHALGLRLDGLAALALGFALAVYPAADHGGVFADTWSWVALVTFFLAAVRLIASPVTGLERLDVAFLAALAAFTGWIALSGLWAPSLTAALSETTRTAAYLGVALLALLTLQRSTTLPLLAGLAAGITTVGAYALATRLLPDRVGSWSPEDAFRLVEPIGYWNGLGLYAAMGTLLALGLVARSDSRVVRGLAGTAPPILVTTMLFTFSRGAWVALAAGLLLAFALDPRRLQLAAAALALAPWPIVALLVADRSDVLTDSTATLVQVTAEGDRFALLVAALALVSGLVALAFGELADRIAVPRAVRTGFAAVLAALALLGLGTLWVAHGPPWEIAERAWEDFTAGPRATGTDLTDRLFDFSNNGRIDHWQVAWHSFERHPVQGEGAGSFQVAWFRDRTTTTFVRDAHGLYAETLGELGLVGLALLLSALALPLVAAVRRRHDPLLVAALAPYAAFLAHAAIDWDWELAGVTIPALLLAGALLVRARRHTPRVLPAVPRVVLPAVAAGLAVVSLFAVLANVPLERARAAYLATDFAQAEAQAERAVRWAPWSSAALQWLGRSQLALGKPDDAAASFVDAVERNPDDWELLRDAAASTGPPEGTPLLRQAIELNPLDPELRILLEAFEAPAPDATP